MPELPEVESIRIGLNSIIGQQIQQVQLAPESILRSLVPNHSLELHRLLGQRIDTIERQGKFLRILTQDFQLLVHLGMSGVLLYQGAQRKHTHIVLSLDNGLIHYSDPRRFGHWELQSKGAKIKSWDQLGLDALDPNISHEHLWIKTRNSKRSIKVLLLDQSLLAGVGNIYASEALFASRIHPERMGLQMMESEWQILLNELQRILSLAIESRGTTFSDYRLTNGKGGEFQKFLQVFQREDCPCKICGEHIIKITQGNRSTFFCKKCQN